MQQVKNKIFFMLCIIIAPIYCHEHDTLNFCTAAESHYFPHLLNLIGSIHHTNFDNLDTIFIYDLGLSEQQINQLNRIDKIKVCALEKTNPELLKSFQVNASGKCVPGWYAWKPVAIKQSLEHCENVVWLDAGTTVLKPLDNLFKHIQEHGYFLCTIGDETGPNTYAYPVAWGTTQYVIKQFGLDDSGKSWILAQPFIMANFIGVSRRVMHKLVMPWYALTKDLKNFADDGTTPNGFGTGRCDQTLLSVLGYSADLCVFQQDYTQNRPILLNVDDQEIPFYITWNGEYVGDKTCVYSSRWDLKNSNFYNMCIKYKK